MTLFGLAASSFRHRRLRTALTALTVAMATGLLAVSLSFLERVGAVTAIENDFVTMRSAVERETFPHAILEEIRGIPGVEPVVWLNPASAGDGDRYQYYVLAVSDGYPVWVNRAWFEVSEEIRQRWVDDRQGIIVHEQTARHFGWATGDAVTLETAAGSFPATVSGIVAGYAPGNVLMHYAHFNEAAAPDYQNNLEFIFIKPTTGTVAGAAQAIDEHFASSPWPSLSVAYSQTMGSLVAGGSSVPELLSRMTWLILIVTGLITISALMMSLRERRGELATLSALGYPQHVLFGLILLESVLTCTAGGVLGASVPLLLFHSQGIDMGTLVLSNVTVELVPSALSVLGAVALGLLAALAPAISVSRQNVLQAMARV